VPEVPETPDVPIEVPEVPAEPDEPEPVPPPPPKPNACIDENPILFCLFVLHYTPTMMSTVPLTQVIVIPFKGELGVGEDIVSTWFASNVMALGVKPLNGKEPNTVQELPELGSMLTICAPSAVKSSNEPEESVVV
jgi:hypothetical protein